jgi:hypothetical protein
MKSILLAALAVNALSVPVFAGDVGISLSVGQPGFYGQINIGNFPQARLIYPQPVVIQRVPEFVSAAPIYLHVPPGHERHWSKHCAEYGACGRPVYFVRDEWYRNEYVPRYHHGGEDQGEGRDHDRGHDHGRGDGHGHGHHDD